MLAIIQTGGKQYKVAVGDKIKVEKITGDEKKPVKFEMLFSGNEKGVELGAPLLKSVVEGKIVGHGRRAKVRGVKHKSKKGQAIHYSHRQSFTEVEITKIG